MLRKSKLSLCTKVSKIFTIHRRDFMVKYKNVLLLNFIVLILILVFFPFLAFTYSIPPYIHYQGRLTDQTNGVPINGKRTMTFSLYATEAGGTPIYFQSKLVTILNGAFSTYLGKGEGYYDGNSVVEGIPPEVFTKHSAHYLGIRVGDSQSEMVPRQLVTSVAYAYKALHAIDASSANRAKEADEAAWASQAGEATNVMGQVTVDPLTGNVGIGTTNPLGPFHIKSNNTDILMTDGQGRVTKPNQPAFLAMLPNSEAWIQRPVVFGTVGFDVGNNYDPNTGRFTAPVSGIYVFLYRIVFGNATQNHRYLVASFYINEENAYGINHTLSAFTNYGNNSYLALSDTMVMHLNAGDYVTVYVGGYHPPWDGKVQTSSCFFSGYLLQ